MPVSIPPLAVSLLLALQLCSTSPQLNKLSVGSASASGGLTAEQEEPVDRLLRSLLDTAAAGSAAATDTRLGLLAGVSTRAFYGALPTPAWTLAADSLTPDAVAALALLADAPAYGLRPVDYGWPRLRALRDSLATHAAGSGHHARLARFDLYLSDAVLRLMSDLYRGRLRPYTLSPREKQAKYAFSFADALRAGLAGGTVRAAVLSCQPANREYHMLQAALAAWRQVPALSDSTGDRPARYEQIALNLERWRWEAIPDSEYVLINLPAFVLQVVRADSVVQEHRVIVGQAKTPTPTLSSAISYFTTAPDWHVPRSIATKEILPRLRLDVGYLARNNYTVYDQQGRPLDPTRINWQQVTPKGFTYTIRQSGGCDNALGNVVFRFRNPYSVYVHDTPAQQLFKQPGRALSHGCIRLENPMQLAAYLLRRDGRVVRLPSEEACANQPKPQDFRLRRSMPLHVRYHTCAVEGGQIRFYPDVYDLDGRLRQQLFPPVSEL